MKSLGDAKSRLSSLLTPLERGALALAMYEDVLDATLALDGWETWVVSADESRPGDRDGPQRPRHRGGATLAAIGDRPDRGGGGRPPDGGARDPARGHPARHHRGAARGAPHPRRRWSSRPRRTSGAPTCCSAARPTPSQAASDPDSFRRHLETAAERGCRRPSSSGRSSRSTSTCRAISSPCWRHDRPGRTLACLPGHGPRGVGSRRAPDGERNVVQGTIKHFDESDRTGSLLTDDRTEVAIDEASLEGSGSSHSARSARPVRGRRGRRPPVARFAPARDPGTRAAAAPASPVGADTWDGTPCPA